jgi:hypothetical protein
MEKILSCTPPNPSVSSQVKKSLKFASLLLMWRKFVRQRKRRKSPEKSRTFLAGTSLTPMALKSQEIFMEIDDGN